MKYIVEKWFNFIYILVVVALFALFFVKDDFALFLIWSQFLIYLVHQFEEYIFPGGFLSYFNRVLLGSSKGDWPLTKLFSFFINVPIIFIGFPLSALLAQKIGLFIAVWTVYFSILNSLSHVGLFIKKGYNPGFVVSLLLNIPVGIFTLYYFVINDLVSISSHIIGFFIAFLIQFTLMIFGFKNLKPKVRENNKD